MAVTTINIDSGNGNPIYKDALSMNSQPVRTGNLSVLHESDEQQSTPDNLIFGELL